jgi:hypothetical protein
MNKELRQHAQGISLEIQLRFLQTHKAEKRFVSPCATAIKLKEYFCPNPPPPGAVMNYSVLDAVNIVPITKRSSSVR